jgi:hypothetical protein
MPDDDRIQYRRSLGLPIPQGGLMRDRDEVRDMAQKLRKLAVDMRVAFGWPAVSYKDNPKSVYGLLMAAADELDPEGSADARPS